MRVVIGALFVSLAWLVPVSGGLHHLPEKDPIATVTIPDAWKAGKSRKGIEVVSADLQVRLEIAAAGAKVAEAISEELRNIKGRGVAIDARSRKQTEANVDGQRRINISWEAKNKRGPMKIVATLVTLARHQHILLVYFASPAAEKKHEADLALIIQSVKPI
jgi:hypothetical protein